MTAPTPTNGRPAPADLTQQGTTPAAAKRSRLGPFAVLWQFWKDYAEKIAHYQTAVLLTIIYYLIAGPTALLARLVGHRFLPQLPGSAPTLWYDTEMGTSAAGAADAQQYLKQF
jgi:hypothetical protein